jgi:hypothetical protein
MSRGFDDISYYFYKHRIQTVNTNPRLQPLPLKRQLSRPARSVQTGDDRFGKQWKDGQKAILPRLLGASPKPSEE